MKIVFDGNIGCGKSTLINKIRNDTYIDLPIYDEPLHNWNEWLELFYSDMNKYSFGFQMRVLKSHLDKKYIPRGIFERSPLSCQRVFGQILYEDNFMNELEWKLTNEYNDDYGWYPDVVIYLRCDPSTSFERVKQRNRPGEEGITYEYLERLHDKYEKLYIKSSNFKVIVIDSNKSFDQVYCDVKDNMLNQLRSQIYRS